MKGINKPFDFVVGCHSEYKGSVKGVSNGQLNTCRSSESQNILQASTLMIREIWENLSLKFINRETLMPGYVTCHLKLSLAFLF